MEQKRLLVVAHAPSANTQLLVDAFLKGANSPEFSGIDVIHIPPLEAGPDDVLAANAIVLGTTENLGYMSGAMKDFFDRSYYPCLEETQGFPYALYIRAGQDGTGTLLIVVKVIVGFSVCFERRIDVGNLQHALYFGGREQIFAHQIIFVVEVLDLGWT